MKVDFSTELTNLNGETLKDGNNPLTLKTICVNAVGGKYQDENLTVEQHVDRFMLASKIHKSNGDGLDLSSEEIVTIKKLLAKSAYIPIVVGQACQMLEGKS